MKRYATAEDMRNMLRQDLRLSTLESMAKRFGVSPATVHGFLSGRLPNVPAAIIAWYGFEGERIYRKKETL